MWTYQAHRNARTFILSNTHIRIDENVYRHSILLTITHTHIPISSAPLTRSFAYAIPIFTASVVLQWSGMPSIYNGLRKSVFTRWTGSATAKILIGWQQQTKGNQTHTMATNPHECAVPCINLMSSKFRTLKPNNRLSLCAFTLASLLFFYHVLILFCARGKKRTRQREREREEEKARKKEREREREMKKKSVCERERVSERRIKYGFFFRLIFTHTRACLMIYP